MDGLSQLGKRIQELRMQRGLTLQSLSNIASVSISMLHSVERGLKAPTVTVLARIAEGLGVSLASLVTAYDDQRVILRRAEDQENINELGGWIRTILSPVIPGVNFEWIRTTLPAYCDAGQFPSYASGSHEFIFVESGVLQMVIGEKTFDLQSGDSLYFAADVTHRYINITEEPCTYYVAALILRSRAPH